MAQAIADATKSLKFWLALLFFGLPLVATPLLDANGENAEFKPWSIQRYVADGDGWTPASMDATTDGTIIIRKLAYPRDTTQRFTFTGDVAGTISSGETLTVADLPPGSYTSTELVPPGWNLSSIECDDGGDSWGYPPYAQVWFNVAPTETVQCTFYNQEDGSEPCHENLSDWRYGPVNAAEASGSYLFSGSGAVFGAYDISSPTNPQPLGAVNLPGLIYDISIQENQAFVMVSVGYEGSLIAVDISDQTSPVVAGSVTSFHMWQDPKVAVAGDYGYVVAGSQITIVDISDPALPSIVSRTYASNKLLDVAVDGSTLFITEAYSGLRVWDAGNPLAPTEIGFLDTPGWASGVTYFSGLALVADGAEGLRLIDVGTPSSPNEVGSLLLPGYSYGVSMTGSHALVAAGSAGLRVIDITDSSNPVEVGAVDDSDDFSTEVRYSGGYAVTSNQESGIRIVDVNPPSSPVTVSSLYALDDAWDIAIQGDYAFVAGYSSGLHVLDLSDPAEVVAVGNTLRGYPVTGVDVHGDHAFVTANSAGLRIIDISDPAAPTQTAFVDTPGFARAVEYHDHFAFVADHTRGLRIIDVMNPDSPFEVGHVDTPGYATDVAVEADHAFVADSGDGLRIIDVSDPSNPVESSFLATTGTFTGVVARGDLVYVSDRLNGLIVIDVANTASPNQVGSFGLSGSASSVSLYGAIAAVALDPPGDDGSTKSIALIDVSDPTTPIGIGFLGDYGPATHVTTSRGRLFATRGETGIEIYQPCDLIFADDYETGNLVYWSGAAAGP